MKYGDVVVQKTQTEIQVEGVFDNWQWVVLKAQHNGKEYLECFGFDGESHCSIPFIKESEYEIVGNIAAILERERVEARIDEVERNGKLVSTKYNKGVLDSYQEKERKQAKQAILAEIDKAIKSCKQIDWVDHTNMTKPKRYRVIPVDELRTNLGIEK